MPATCFSCHPLDFFHSSTLFQQPMFRGFTSIFPKKKRWSADPLITEPRTSGEHSRLRWLFWRMPHLGLFCWKSCCWPDFFDQKATENERSLGKCPCFRRKIICGSNFSGPNTGYGLGQLDPRFHGVRLHQPKCWVYWDLINRKI